jgi:hypothetical protein
MKITLDQQTLAQAVTNHLRSVGVQSDILQVEFRYTRVPYTVFAEVELAEAPAPPTRKTPAPAREKEAVPVVAAAPIVDPDNLPALTEEDQSSPDVPPSDTPSSPIFGGE